MCDKQTVDCQLETDASASGWGGQVFNLQASGMWSADVSYQHSNFRELLAVYMSLKSFVNVLRGRKVQILSHNVTAVAYLNHLGGPNALLSDLMTTIWCFAHNQDIKLTAKHLAEDLNFRADRLSRLHSPYEWRLHKKVFSYLDLLWGPHDVDRFAAAHNKQLRRFNSLFWDPESEAVDALAQNWENTNSFVNPPFWLIPRILDLIQAQGNSVTATIIAGGG